MSEKGLALGILSHFMARNGSKQIQKQSFSPSQPPKSTTPLGNGQHGGRGERRRLDASNLAERRGEGGAGREPHLLCLRAVGASKTVRFELETARNGTEKPRFEADYSHPFMHIDVSVVPEAVKPIPPMWVNDVELDEFGAEMGDVIGEGPVMSWSAEDGPAAPMSRPETTRKRPEIT